MHSAVLERDVYLMGQIGWTDGFDPREPALTFRIEPTDPAGEPFTAIRWSSPDLQSEGLDASKAIVLKRA